MHPQSHCGHSNEEPSSGLRLLDFWKHQEDKHLRESVESSEGEIDLLVHPFAVINTDGIKRDQVKVQLRESRKHKERVVESIGTSTRPVLILEEEEGVDHTQVLLMTNRIKKPVYLIGTWVSNPEPLKGKRRGEGWDEFIERLKSLGVSRVNLGGRFYCEDSQGKEMGCVSEARDKLVDDFTVNIDKSLCCEG